MIGRRGVLAGLGAAALAPPRSALALPEPAVERIRRAYLDGPFGQLHVRIAEPAGSRRGKPPLVLLHQTPLSGRMFERALPLLAAGRTVIAVDTPGYGESDRPANRPTLAEYGDAIVQALVPRFGRRFDWLGYHTGAVIAADLAARRREAVRKLVLVSFPLFDQARRDKLLAQMAAPESPYADDGSHLPPLWTGTFGVRPPGQSLDDVARIVAEKQRPGRFREWALRSAMEVDLAPLLKRIARPTLVLAPEDGLQAETARAAELVPGSRLLRAPDLRHGLFDAAPARIAELVLPFLDTR
jgi:pimeloyl-ACP methyl ester carboxylesterase